MVSKKNKQGNKTYLAGYIDQHMKEQRKSYVKLASYCGFPKAYVTRLKAGQWIPTPRQCTNIGGFLHIPWHQVWVAAGHLRQDEVDRLMVRNQMPFYRLDDTEAEIINSYRFCNEDTSVYLTAAVRGAARASENITNGTKRQHRVTFLLEMDFVNYPQWLEDVQATHINDDYPKVFRINESNGFDYLAQSTVVGTLRFSQTRVMSPLPRQLWADD